MNLIDLYYKTHRFFEKECSKEVGRFHKQERGEDVKRLPRFLFSLFSKIEYNMRPQSFRPKNRRWPQFVFFLPIALYFDLKFYHWEQVNRGDAIWEKFNSENVYFTR